VQGGRDERGKIAVQEGKKAICLSNTRTGGDKERVTWKRRFTQGGEDQKKKGGEGTAKRVIALVFCTGKCVSKSKDCLQPREPAD